MTTAETPLSDLSHNNSPPPPPPPPPPPTTTATSPANPSKPPSLHIESDPKSALSPDCNGANGIHHHREDDDDRMPQDDADDNSYVFVTRNHDSPLPFDKDRDQHHHLNGTAPLVSAHSHPIDLHIATLATETDATPVAASINGLSMDASAGDAFPVGGTTAAGSEIVQQNNGSDGVSAKAEAEPLQLANAQFDSELPFPAPIEKQESEVAVLVPQSDVDLVEVPEAQIPPLRVAKSTDVHQRSEEDTFDSVSMLQEKIQEFPLTCLESIPGKSPNVSKTTSTAQPHSQSFDEVGDTQNSGNGHCDATHCVVQQIDVQKVNLEDQIGTDSTTIAEERVECGVLLTSTRESESSESDKSARTDEGEETKTELLSEAKHPEETIIGPGKNAESNLDQELEAENSANEVDLLSTTASGPALNKNEDHFPASSFAGSVPDIKQSYEYSEDKETHSKESNDYADDGDKTGEQHQFFADAVTLVPAISCVERETDSVRNPVESVQNVQVSTKEHESQDETSPLTENVIDSDKKVCRPETEVVDNVAVQSTNEVPNISREHEIENAACPSSENVVVGMDEVIKSETGVVSSVSGNLGSVISSPNSDSRSEIIQSGGVNDNGLVGGASIQSCFPNTTISGTEFELGTADSREKILTFQVNDVHSKCEVGTLDDACAHMQSLSSVSEVNYEVENSSGIGGPAMPMPCSNTVAIHTEVSNSSVVTCGTVPNLAPEIKDVENQVDQLSVLDLETDDKLICQEGKNMEKSQSNEIFTSLSENSSTDALAGQDVGFGPLTRPFRFLIRIPRFDDLKVREQIRLAQLQVEEKTKHRDAFRLEIQKHKANCQGHAAEYEAAVSKARASKRSVKSKRAEIDSLQSVINKVKNAISVEDIDGRIYGMEHMIQHETLPLKEEKQFIREIKQLKQLREQLSSNIGSQDEVQQALNERDEIEERLKILKKELDNLKDGVLKAEAVARAAQKQYEDESKKLKELISQFEAANDIRQAAYNNLQSLKKELFEKNKHFRTYKENAAAASNYATSKDREALHLLCVNQVETILDLWNKDDAFRKEYVKCNMRSTLRRLGTLDGRSLGPDEEPPELTSYGAERINRLVSNPTGATPVLQTQILKQGSQLKHIEYVPTDDSTKVKEVEVKNQTAKVREPVKPILGNSLATISGRGISDDEIREKEHMPTKEELELVRKAEELRKTEVAAKLREQRRLEEKAKALEALERKKRIAEKAQMRADLRAQKEAELKEKEREKRLRKKERKKAGGAEVPDSNNIGESTPISEIVTETIKEPDVKDTSPAVTKKTQKPAIFMKQSKTKSIPPPLRNRGKRKVQQWMWVIFTCVVVIVLFFLGNIGFFSNLSNLRQRGL